MQDMKYSFLLSATIHCGTVPRDRPSNCQQQAQKTILPYRLRMPPILEPPCTSRRRTPCRGRRPAQCTPGHRCSAAPSHSGPVRSCALDMADTWNHPMKRSCQPDTPPSRDLRSARCSPQCRCSWSGKRLLGIAPEERTAALRHSGSSPSTSRRSPAASQQYRQPQSTCRWRPAPLRQAAPPPQAGKSRMQKTSTSPSRSPAYSSYSNSPRIRGRSD
mmetsp:Transcript_48655/g.115507  ORF Transcript_48655/g.115507 Transcript_48655/m.115507 type:complete len:217 (-) Transcript_48655:371-1021(-)